jgi:hypothetical protein
LNFPEGILPGAIGYLNGGGVGWSFIPRTNLTVTEVAYLAGQELPDAVICIWAGTNGPIATFTNLTVPQPTSRQLEVLFAPVPPLPLAAGEEYRITFHKGSWPDQYTTSIVQPFKLEDCAPELRCFLPAPEIQFLTNYSFAGYVFTPQPDSALSASSVYVGPTFRFELATPEKSPLQVLHDGAVFVLTWPASLGVSVEASDDLRSASWPRSQTGSWRPVTASF